ncbi:hypothetical protein K440DRAFT_634767 [Wilcoxina mikolae CBS 423.85]|nr:hypothetical protein K440DRAFT_634767 [Wilcoxina mikolae CBS 423.85]
MCGIWVVLIIAGLPGWLLVITNGPFVDIAMPIQKRPGNNSLSLDENFHVHITTQPIPTIGEPKSRSCRD